MDSYQPGALGEFLATKKKRKSSENVSELFDKKPKKKIQRQKPVETKEETEEKIEATEKGTRPQKPKRTEEETNRTVFVGNLPLNITPRQFKKLFTKFGKIESVRLRSIVGADVKLPKKVVLARKEFAKEKDSLNGYVKFVSPENAQAALEMNGTVVDEHHIRVDGCWATGKCDSRCSVFVGNLPYSTSEEQLREFFTDCGKIKAIRLIRERHSAVGKGFGYVNFTDSATVSLALRLNGAEFGEREIRVKRVMNKYKQEQEAEKLKERSKKNKVEGPKSAFDGKQKMSKKLHKKINKKRKLRHGKTLMK